MNTLSLAMRMAATLTGSSTVPPGWTHLSKRSCKIAELFACSLATALAWNTALAQQVGVGTTTPANSAILDVTSTNKGVLFPRVALTSGTDTTTVPSPAIGLMVFNTGTGGLTNVGFVFWNGTEWRAIDSFSTTTPFANPDCLAASLDPATLTAGSAYTGFLRVPYSSGNGIKYAAGTSIASTGNTGLSAKLLEGTLANGQGTLVYSVTGTPALSTPTGANFAISFAGNSCTATVGDISVADGINVAAIGPLVPTNDNGVPGWHQVISTPDGKFSFRAFIPKRNGSTWANDRNFNNINLQIRSNGAARTISWIGTAGYQGGALAPNGSLSTSVTAGTWSGISLGATSATAITAAAPEPYILELWADLSPELRSFTFTEVANGTTVSYTVEWTFFTNQAHTTLITDDATAAKSKNVFAIRQLTAR